MSGPPLRVCTCSPAPTESEDHDADCPQSARAFFRPKLPDPKFDCEHCGRPADQNHKPGCPFYVPLTPAPDNSVRTVIPTQRPKLSEGGYRGGLHFFPGAETTVFRGGSFRMLCEYLEWGAQCECDACGTYAHRALRELSRREIAVGERVHGPQENARANLGTLPRRLSWVRDLAALAEYKRIFQMCLSGDMSGAKFSWRIVRDLFEVIDHLTKSGDPQP